jgi:hypothetical protein
MGGNNISRLIGDVPSGADRINMWQALRPGAHLRSQSGAFTFDFQEDRNCVLYLRVPAGHVLPDAALAQLRALYPSRTINPIGRSVLWATNTCGSGAEYLMVQSDENVVLRKDNGDAVWDKCNSLTPIDGAHLVLHEGVLVLYNGRGDALWTNQKGSLGGGPIEVLTGGLLGALGLSLTAITFGAAAPAVAGCAAIGAGVGANAGSRNPPGVGSITVGTPMSL